MRRAAIVAPVRTAVGTFGGSLRALRAEDLAAKVVEATVQRSGVDPGRIEDVVFAQSYANSEAPCIGRWVALHANLPVEVPGLQIDRRCGGGLQAVITAAMTVQTGAADVVIAGGVESMSNIEHYTTTARWGARSGNQTLYDRLDRGRERSQPSWRFGEISGMIETAENLASDFGIDRDAADAFAARSHQRAAAAIDSGAFDAEIVAIEVPQRRGEPVAFDCDEGVRPNTTAATLAKLRTLMPDGTVTAGNSSQQNDAAAACLVVAEDRLEELGLEPIGYLEGWAAVGCEPSTDGHRTGRRSGKAVQQNRIRFRRSLLDRDQRGVRRSGARGLVRLGRQARRRRRPSQRQWLGNLSWSPHRSHRCPDPHHDAARVEDPWWGIGLETMCIGGGQGIAALFRGVDQ